MGSGKNIRTFCLLGSLSFCGAQTVSALPIGFGRAPGDLDYSEQTSKHFRVYHDARAPAEGRFILKSLETARPHLDSWFDKKRSSPLPVIVSASTANASFANFITDALELQTLGQGDRDLVFHEMVHETMYRHFKNWLGPAGSILHLIWLPSWWVEGLAEALSVSVGSDVQAGMERYQALSDDWPSYAKLHSLYTSGDFSWRGYATSGAFVSWILRKGVGKELGDFHDSYAYKSMPWMWPYSILPLPTSMPLDWELHNRTGKTGEELYEEYKQDAKEHWQSVSKEELLSARAGRKSSISYATRLSVRGNDVFGLENEGEDYLQTKLSFQNDFANVNDDDTKVLGSEWATTAHHVTKGGVVFAKDATTIKGQERFQIVHQTLGGDADKKSLFTRSGQLLELGESKNLLYWLEQVPDATRFCAVEKNALSLSKGIKLKSLHCDLKKQTPERITFLGARSNVENPDYMDEVWLGVAKETVKQTRQEIHRWNAASRELTKMSWPEQHLVEAAALSKDEHWLLVRHRTGRDIWRIDANGKCAARLTFADVILGIKASNKGDLYLSLYAGARRFVYQLPRKKQNEQACPTSVDGLISPLLVAARAPKKNMDLSSALSAASTWKTSSMDEGKAEEALATEEEAPTDSGDSAKLAKPSKWRVRPVFGVPWIGADSGGTQLGFLSVPLMDEMQNEDVRLYLAYGPESRFPHTEVSIQSTRFWVQTKLDLFRYQTWNGEYRDYTDGSIKSAYLDERGVRLSGDVELFSWNTNLQSGIKASHLDTYRAPPQTKTGWLYEPYAQLSKYARWGYFSWSGSIEGRVAPKFMNETFDYNTLGVATNLTRTFDFLDLRAGLGADGSRTRGKERRELREVYRPLKIYVPGSGSGYNDLFFPIYGNGSLFDAQYGDTQARGRADLTLPLVDDFEQLVRLFYLDSLDLTGFYNYGGAWRGDSPEMEDLLSAHGYTLDLHLDLKGFNFNLGGGVGQVVGDNWQGFMSFRFDAIF